MSYIYTIKLKKNMKTNLIKLFTATFVLAFIAFACSKDQKVVRQLDGEWKVTEVKYNGVVDNSTDYSSWKYKFEKCKVSKGDCSGSWTTIDPTKGETTFDFTYSISEKGTKITINLNILGLTESTTGDIIEHSKTKFIWSEKDATSGDVTEITIEKI